MHELNEKGLYLNESKKCRRCVKRANSFLFVRINRKDNFLNCRLSMHKILMMKIDFYISIKNDNSTSDINN